MSAANELFRLTFRLLYYLSKSATVFSRRFLRDYFRAHLSQNIEGCTASDLIEKPLHVASTYVTAVFTVDYLAACFLAY